MDEDTIAEYMKDRFAPALEFYDKRSGMYKKWYRVLSVYVIVSSAALTALIAIGPEELYWRVLTTCVSASIVISTGLLAHYKSHENWLSYRATWDALKREREYYRARLHHYEDATQRHALFVDRVESILAREAAEFYSRHKKRDEPSESASHLDTLHTTDRRA